MGKGSRGVVNVGPRKWVSARQRGGRLLRRDQVAVGSDTVMGVAFVPMADRSPDGLEFTKAPLEAVERERLRPPGGVATRAEQFAAAAGQRLPEQTEDQEQTQDHGPGLTKADDP